MTNGTLRMLRDSAADFARQVLNLPGWETKAKRA
jgi:hypothetical protein